MLCPQCGPISPWWRSTRKVVGYDFCHMRRKWQTSKGLLWVQKASDVFSQRDALRWRLPLETTNTLCAAAYFVGGAAFCVLICTRSWSWLISPERKVLEHVVPVQLALLRVWTGSGVSWCNSLLPLFVSIHGPSTWKLPGFEGGTWHQTGLIWFHGAVSGRWLSIWLAPMLILACLFQNLAGTRTAHCSGLARVSAHPRPPKSRKPSATAIRFPDWIGGMCYANTLQVWFPAHWASLVIRQLQRKEDEYRIANPSWVDQTEVHDDLVRNGRLRPIEGCSLKLVLSNRAKSVC